LLVPGCRAVISSLPHADREKAFATALFDARPDLPPEKDAICFRFRPGSELAGASPDAASFVWRNGGMTQSFFKRLTMFTGLGAVSGMAVFGMTLGSGGAAAQSAGGIEPLKAPLTTSTALVATPQIHATYDGKCVASSPNC
jgi:hypothetical protein